MKVICIGSGRGMTKINDWDTDGITIAGVNNTWKGTDKWDVLLHAGDYPYKRSIKKTRDSQLIVSREGSKGFKTSYIEMTPCDEEPEKLPWEKARIHLGLPIHFTLTYWVLHYLKPTCIGYLGFDMDYQPGPEGETTFYGVGYDMQKRGVPDPLYQFQNVPEYKKHPNMMEILFDRLRMRTSSCKLVNISDNKNSILPWEQVTFDEFKGY